MHVNFILEKCMLILYWKNVCQFYIGKMYVNFILEKCMLILYWKNAC